MFRNTRNLSKGDARANRTFEELESRQLCTVTVTPIAPDTRFS